MRHVCGLDVHKDSVFVCILNEKGVVFQEKFGVLTPELERMAAVMLEYGVTEVGMESTSIYWMPVWRVIDPYVEQKLVNPDFIRQLSGQVGRSAPALQHPLERLRFHDRLQELQRRGRGYSQRGDLPDTLLECIHGRIVNKHGADVIGQLREEIELARNHARQQVPKADHH